MIEKIIKRSGNVVDYNREKIIKAIRSAELEANENIINMSDIIHDIEKVINKEFGGTNLPTVEQIQDIVEEKLMEFNYHQIAKRYIIYREERNKERDSWLKEGLAKSIWERKYRFNGESFEEFLDRIAKDNDKIKRRIRKKQFLPAGRLLANRGLQNKGKKITYSNCYVITPPNDTLEGIFDVAKKLARTYSYGGGCGTNLNNLRPAGAKVNNAAKETTGSVSFMPLYSLVTDIIGQKYRRGALMLSLTINHPDIEEFIDLKTDLDSVTKANISIEITDEFMKAVQTDKEFELKFIVEDTGEIIKKTVDARRLFNKLAYSNWYSAEPGALFWDRIENYNLLGEDDEFSFAGVNPCAEEPLPAGGSCLLSSINLDGFVKNKFKEDAEFDFEQFEEMVSEGIEYLNQVMEEGLELHPLQEQKDSVDKYKQIGLGIMGLADMFISLGIKYGSEKSLELVDKIGSILANKALQTSALLAKENGTFPAYKEEAILNSEYFKSVANAKTKKLVKNYGLRNSQLLTIAPTGTISNLLGISGGIEPIFDISYIRKTETLYNEDVSYEIFTPIAERYMSEMGIYSKEDLPDIFVTAHTLNSEDRIDMQSRWQKYIDASISSTINLDNSATVEDIKNIYMYAWKQGLKGVTVYRDGCARSGILSTDNKDNKTELTEEEMIAQNICPECKGEIINTGGCEECTSCGYSPCSI